jgi:hypothetical protein
MPQYTLLVVSEELQIINHSISPLKQTNATEGHHNSALYSQKPSIKWTFPIRNQLLQ